MQADGDSGLRYDVRYHLDDDAALPVTSHVSTGVLNGVRWISLVSQPALISSQIAIVGGHALTQRTKLVDEGNRTEMAVRTRRIDPRPHRAQASKRSPRREFNHAPLLVAGHFVLPGPRQTALGSNCHDQAKPAMVGLGIIYGVDGWR